MAYNYSRYINRQILKNASGAYSKQLSERKLKFIEHYNTAEFKYHSDEFLGSFASFNCALNLSSNGNFLLLIIFLSSFLFL